MQLGIGQGTLFFLASLLLSSPLSVPQSIRVRPTSARRGSIWLEHSTKLTKILSNSLQTLLSVFQRKKNWKTVHKKASLPKLTRLITRRKKYETVLDFAKLGRIETSECSSEKSVSIPVDHCLRSWVCHILLISLPRYFLPQTVLACKVHFFYVQAPHSSVFAELVLYLHSFRSTEYTFISIDLLTCVCVSRGRAAFRLRSPSRSLYAWRI